MKEQKEKEVTFLEALRDEISNMKMRTLEPDTEDHGLRFTRGGGSRPKHPIEP